MVPEPFPHARSFTRVRFWINEIAKFNAKWSEEETKQSSTWHELCAI